MQSRMIVRTHHAYRRILVVSLERKLGFWGVFSIAAGAMISSGLFVLPGLAFAAAGPAVVLSYAFAGVLVIPAMMSKAELAPAATPWKSTTNGPSTVTSLPFGIVRLPKLSVEL